MSSNLNAFPLIFSFFALILAMGRNSISTLSESALIITGGSPEIWGTIGSPSFIRLIPVSNCRWLCLIQVVPRIYFLFQLSSSIRYWHIPKHLKEQLDNFSLWNVLVLPLPSLLVFSCTGWYPTYFNKKYFAGYVVSRTRSLYHTALKDWNQAVVSRTECGIQGEGFCPLYCGWNDNEADFLFVYCPKVVG